MPKIILVSGEVLHVTRDKAVEVKAYLDDDVLGHRVDDILDPVKKQKVEEFISTVSSVDFSDIKKIQTKRHVNHEQIRAVMQDTELKGYAKFAAMRKAMGG